MKMLQAKLKLDENALRREGAVVTFYSYKGGAGRSMALANSACLAARNLTKADRRVLVIDWDLEAPGLHKFFPISEQPANADRKGILEYFHQLQQHLRAHPSLYEQIMQSDLRNQPASASPDEVLDDILQLTDHIVRDAASGVDMIRAGSLGKEYSELLAAFSWKRFYQEFGAVFAAFRALLARQYAYVFIDSRTGLTDVSGICTSVLPDKLVAVFTPNEQSLTGLLAIVEQVISYRRASPDLRPLTVYPLPCRVEVYAENELRRRWRKRYQNAFEDTLKRSYGIPECNLGSYFDQVEIPHVTYYLFGERLAVNEPGDEAVSLKKSYERFYDYLVHRESAWELVEHVEEHGAPTTTLPPLPPNFVAREQELNALLDALKRDASKPRHTIALTAIMGMGGIGKTVLAQALCLDRRTKELFPDGIFWQTMGKESNIPIEGRLRAIRRALGNSRNDIQSEIDEYRATIGKKKALVVVDDVWHLTDIEPWLVDSPGSCVLFTTRDLSIAYAVGAQPVSTALLNEDQARKMFANYVGINVEKLPTLTREIIDECGRLPLAVSLVGAMLRGKPLNLWHHTVDLLKNAKIARISTQFPNYPYPSIFVAIAASVNDLSAIDQRRYLALAVLLEDMSIPSTIQQTLWATDADETAETAERLISRSLARRKADGQSIHLHDLQLDYIRAQYQDRRALELIHGAMRLSSHVIERDTRQFASQLVGRLLAHESQVGVQKFTAALRRGAPRPWLMLRRPALDSPGGALIRTLTGHTGDVLGVAMSGDGRRAVSASADQTLRLWDVENGRELRTLTGHSSDILGVAMSRDGKRVISASADQTLKLWDVEGGRELLTLTGHTSYVLGVAMSGDGRLVISASADQTLKVWDIQSGGELRTLKGHTDSVRGVAISDDARCAISASADRTLKVWDVEGGRELRTLKGHASDVLGVAISKDGRRAVSSSVDRTLKVWNLESGRESLTLKGHTSSVWSVAIGADGKRVISASGDQTLKVWDLESGQELLTLEGHTSAVSGVAISTDAKLAVSASADRTLKVWDMESGQELLTLAGHKSFVWSLATSHDGRFVVSASADQTLKVWDAESGQELRVLVGHRGSVYGASVSGNGRRIASAADDRTSQVWDLESGTKLCTLSGHTNSVLGVAMNRNGSRIVSASADQTLRVWDTESGKELHMLRGHTGSVLGVALREDGRRAVSASADQTLKVWDLDSGRGLRTLKGHTDDVYEVTISRDGRLAISASADQTLRVWDVESGRELTTLKGHTGRVFGAAVSRNAKYAASASDDKTVKVWDLESRVELATFTCEGPALCCAFAGGTSIIAGDAGGRIYFLELMLEKSKSTVPRKRSAGD